MYISYDNLLTYNCIIYLLSGGRGIGKTFGAKLKLIKWFLKDKSQFVWIRRYKTELKYTKNGFFNKVADKFLGVDFNIKGDYIYINNELAGIFVPLSNNSAIKGIDALKNVKTFVFDEYIIDTKNHQRYLNNEFQLLLDIFESFARNNKFRFFALSNAISYTAPLYVKLGVDLTDVKKIVNNEVYAEEFKTSKELEDIKSNSCVGLLSKKYDEQYYNYNVSSQSLNDSKDFIIDEPKRKQLLYCIKFDNLNVYVYLSRLNENKIYYCSLKGSNTTTRYTISIKELDESTQVFEKSQINKLIRAIQKTNVYYDCILTKNTMIKILKYFMR